MKSNLAALAACAIATFVAPGVARRKPPSTPSSAPTFNIGNTTPLLVKDAEKPAHGPWIYTATLTVGAGQTSPV